MNDYTPTTDEVRRGFTAPRFRIDPQGDGESFADYLGRVSIEGFGAQILSEEAFDRWLAAHDAKVKAEAWDEGFRYRSEWNLPQDNPYRRTE